MPPLNISLRHSRITTRFIVWFLVISLLPLAIAITLSYSSSRHVLEEEGTKRLIAVAENKAEKIKAYFQDKEEGLTQLSLLPDISTAILESSAALRTGGTFSSGYSVVEKRYRPLVTYYQKSLGFSDIMLVTPDGTIVFSVVNNSNRYSLASSTLSGANKELAAIFRRAVKSSKTEVSNFIFDKTRQKGLAFVAAPVTEGGNLIGAVMAELTTEGISQLIQDYTGLGASGETILAAGKENQALCITPLRFDAQAAFQREIYLGPALGSDMQKAVQKQDGSGIILDYRGKKVLSVWKYLPSFQLGMAVKMDTEELFASARRVRNNLLVLGLALIVAVLITAVAVAHSISNPINEVTKISSIISCGNLSARANIANRDEIGDLAASFNRMTDSLVAAKTTVEEERTKLTEQKQLLEQANKELDNFVYTASHDLRAPLRGISRFASFLEEDYIKNLDDAGKNYILNICKSVKRMDKLIEDLLTLSRISRIKNPYEDVAMDNLISAAIERLKFDIKEHRAELKIQEGLPTVRCDRIKMAEVFLNLINNAIKFSSKNNPENPKVTIGFTERDISYEFFIKDNGIGIHPKYHGEIFVMFRRLHPESEYEGTGAGLSIVKRIIDDHGGKIWIQSEEGMGATFYFTIPKELRVPAT